MQLETHISTSSDTAVDSSKFGNFYENFIFANSAKRHICHVKNSPLWHDLPTSVNDRVFSPFREGFISTKLP